MSESMMTGPTARPAGIVPSGGAWLRIVLAAAAAGLCVVSWIPTTGAAAWLQALLMLGILGWMIRRPGAPGTLFLLAGALAVQLIGRTPVVNGTLIGLVLLVPLVHQLAALAAAVPPRSRLVIAAVVPSLLRYLVTAGLVLIVVLIVQLSS